jgi:hypothetical protein
VVAESEHKDKYSEVKITDKHTETKQVGSTWSWNKMFAKATEA